MTRKEEITIAAFKCFEEEESSAVTAILVVGFARGAEWADRTMIDKACEWLRVELDKEELHYIHVHGFDKERREIFLEDFRKAMEGE